MKNALFSYGARAKRRGFTLMEIMMVLLLIAGLAAGAIASLTSVSPKGKASSDLQTLSQMQSAADTFVMNLGYVPATWYTASGGVPDGKTMTAAQITAMITHLTGVATGASTDDDFARNNPVLRQNRVGANYATRLSAVVTNSGTGSTSGTRVVILQFRGSSGGLFVNGDTTVSTALLPAATAMTAPDYFDSVANTAWTTAGKAAWPWTN